MIFLARQFLPVELQIQNGKSLSAVDSVITRATLGNFVRTDRQHCWGSAKIDPVSSNLKSAAILHYV